MSEDTKMVAFKREDSGTAAARGLRREGRVPGVVYSAGKPAKSVALDEHEFDAMLRHRASENVIVDLDIEGDKVRHVLLKDIQHHPVNGRMLHIDFYEVKKGQKLKVEVQIELQGTPEGVSQDGGILEHILRTVEVEVLPKDLVESFVLDVSQMNIGDNLTVADLDVDREKFAILTDDDVAIAAVAAPRIVEEEEEGEEEGAEGAEGAEPEVIGEKGGEGEESSEES